VPLSNFAEGFWIRLSFNSLSLSRSAKVNITIRFFFAPSVQQPAGSTPPSPGQHGHGLSAAHLESLEAELRQALKEARKVYEDEKQLLRRHFQSVDDGDSAVDAGEFVALWARLHVSVSPHEAAALFSKFAAPGATSLSYAQVIASR
jgi:hypothetical protein